MELKPSKRKKYSAPASDFHVELSNLPKITAQFNGVHVSVKDPISAGVLHKLGYFGKGTLSRGEPTFNTSHYVMDNVITEQQFFNRLKGGLDVAVDTSVDRRRQYEDSIQKLLSAPFIDSRSSWRESRNECDKIRQPSTDPSSNQLSNDWLDKPADGPESSRELTEMVDKILTSKELRYQTQDARLGEALVFDQSGSSRFEEGAPPTAEVLSLSLCETFFLTWALVKLTVLDPAGNELSAMDMWQTFRQIDENFVHRYAAYHWYRSRGWIVRSGLKYGGDFLLYEKGPNYCHSSYLICLRHERRVTENWSEIIMYQRLVETFKKDVIFCHVTAHCEIKLDDLETPAVISKYNIKEVMCRRWIPSQKNIVA